MATDAHHGGDGPPLLLLHGVTDTWRTWELVLPQLEEHHEVLAPTLLGHHGGPPYAGDPSPDAVADQPERDLDRHGWDTAHVAGNSLGGALALELARRGRAKTVVALAPGGGWAPDAFRDTAAFFRKMHALLQQAAPHADAIASTPEGRRNSLKFIAVRTDHVPADFVAHQLRGAADCDLLLPLMDLVERDGLVAELGSTVPTRIVWGRKDAILAYPETAERFERELPEAEWVVLDDVGHCPQLDVPDETARLILEVTTRW